MKLLMSIGVAMVLSVGASWALTGPDANSGAANRSHQATVSNPSQLIPNYDIAHLGPIVTEMGINWQQRTTQNGRQFIAAKVKGLDVVLLPSACLGNGNENCVGLQLLAYFSGQRLSPGLVWRYNNDNVFSYVGLESDDDFFVRRYEIADHGVPRGNVEASIQNFRASVNNVIASFSAPGAGVNADPGIAETPTAMVERRLEEAQLLSGNRTMVPSSHANQEFIDASLLDLLTDPAMPTNVIIEAPESLEAVP